MQGLEYIHSSDVHVHGNLKSSNVVVDARFQCKLTDIHISQFTPLQPRDEPTYSTLKGNT